MNDQYKQLITAAYDAFNARDIDQVLSLMDKNVHWPNGWEGGYVNGHEEVRAYWTRQWKELDPNVQPISINERSSGVIEVLVHQVVKNLQGDVLFDGTVKHVYTVQNGLIQGMEIENG